MSPAVPGALTLLPQYKGLSARLITLISEYLRRSLCGNISTGTQNWPDILIRSIYYSCALLQGYKPIPISNVNPLPGDMWRDAWFK